MRPASPRRWSLGARLRLIAALTTLTAGLIGAVAVYSAANRESDRLFDLQLKDLASTLLTFAENDIPADSDDRPLQKDSDAARQTGFQYQIWSHSGRLLLHSSNAPATAPLLPLGQTGYGDLVQDGQAVRAYTNGSAHSRLTVQVAGKESIHDDVLGALGGYLAAFIAVSLLALYLLSRVMLRAALRPIDESAQQLRERGPLNLERLQVDNPPQELLPIIESIDALFARIAHSLSVERNLTAAASHELKTPLAALRLHAQVAARAQDEQDRATALRAVITCVDRITHLLHQLLVLARVDSLQQQEAAMSELSLERVYLDVMSDLQESAAARHIRLRADLGQTTLRGLEFGVFTLLRNLLANAIQYSPEGGEVHLAATRSGQVLQLTVDDAGPGIPAALRERAFERFYRLPDTRGAGAGLGLAIAQSIAQLHGARIELLDSPLGGLRVQVQFAASPPAAA